jgi:hypothetical protein
LVSVKEITPILLVSLGVTEARQQTELSSNYRKWIQHMYRAGEYAVALEGSLQFLQSHSEHVERWQVADLHLLVAKLWWRHKRFTKSLLAIVHAVITWPAVTGRLLEAVSRRLRRV